VDAHWGNCCPICEEKIIPLSDGRYGLKDGTVENIFFKDKLMKPHILRVHLRPYRCLVPPCSKRFDSRGLKKHLGFGGTKRTLFSIHDTPKKVEIERNACGEKFEKS